MLAFEPPSLMELRWGPDIVRLELRPTAAGTELTLLDTLDERGKAARDGAGWHTCLDSLEAALSGDPDARDRMGTWQEVNCALRRELRPRGGHDRPARGVRAGIDAAQAASGSAGWAGARGFENSMPSSTTGPRRIMSTSRA